VIAQPKKTKEDRAKEKAKRKKDKKKSPRALKMERNRKNPNSSLWINKCDSLFMSQGHGKPCVICESKGITNREGTVFHHHVAKSTCKALRYDLMNMVILCPQHHCFSNEIGAHSSNPYAQKAYMDWVQENLPEQYEYCKEHQHNKTRFKFKEWAERFQELKDQGLPIERKVND